MLLKLTPPAALRLGALPFIAGDLLKTAAVLAVARGMRR